MPITAEVFRKYLNRILVETGSNLGDGIAAGVDSGFEKIYSMEIYRPNYDFCAARFKQDKRVEMVFGDSSKDLANLLKNINEPVTWWLDAHWSGVGTGHGDKFNPILEELEQISQHNIRNHTILIDDVRLMGTAEFCFVIEKQIKDRILMINQNYVFAYENGYCRDDILACVVR